MSAKKAQSMHLNDIAAVGRTALVPKMPERYVRQLSVRKELPVAYELYSRGSKVLADCYQALIEHAPQALIGLDAFVDDCVASALRTPDALAAIAMLDNSQSAHHACLRSAMFALLTAWHLGLKAKRMKVLVKGCLLAELGKLKLDDDLLENEDFLSTDQLAQFQRYPELGAHMLSSLNELPKAVLSIVAQHCERYDGSGFPHGLGASKQHSLAQIASIAYYYQALLSFKPYADGLSVLDANTQLFNGRDEAFDKVLVEHFIEALGLYPCGSLVELNDGQVAMVLEQGQERRLWPRLLLLLDSHKQVLKKPRELDLGSNAQQSLGADRLAVHLSLPSGAYDLSLTHPRILPLLRKSRWSFG